MTSPRLALACAALSGVIAVPVRALGAQERRDTLQLSAIVVTATRLPTPIGSVANGVTVISGAELRTQGITHLLDALRIVPGAAIVQTGSFGGQTSLFLRGGESDYVRVLVDGVSVNQPGGTLDLANLSTDNVDRIEVVRGPASVLYGSDAVAGVVQIFTRGGSGAPRVRLAARTGTYRSSVLEGGIVGGGRRASYSLSGSRFGSDGAYAFNNGYRNLTTSALLRLAPDDRTEARLSARHSDSEFHFPTDFAGALVDSNQLTAGTLTAVGFELGRFLTRRLEGRLLLASTAAADRSEDLPDGPADSEASRSRSELRRRSADVRANLYLAALTVLTAGAALERQEGRSSFEYRAAFGSGADSADVTRGNRAYYAQALVGRGDRLSVTAGLRLEDNEAFGTFRTYRAGVVYQLRGSARFRGVWGTAFKEPTFCETYGGCFATGNPRLRPERSRSWEVGVEQALAGSRAVLAGTYFDQRFRHMIQYTFGTPEPGDPNFYNVAGAEARGVELEARVSPLRDLSLVARYTYLRTEASDSGFDGTAFAEGQRLLRRPARTANVAAGYRLAGRGSLSLSVLYVGRRDELDFRNLDPVTFQPMRVELRPYTRFDLSGELEVLSARSASGFTVTLRVENLLNASYEEVRYFPARGRTVFVGGRLDVGS